MRAGLEPPGRIPWGLVHINDQPLDDQTVAPLGGVQASGTGCWHGGAPADIESFTETQRVSLRGNVPTHPLCGWCRGC